MKELFFGFIVLLIFSGCKNEIIPPSSTDQDGQIILKIDRQNAPQNIVTVTAYLTRPNFNTITGTLNLLTDTTAELSLQNIPSGQWHLKVDASDSLGVVKYSGETDVNIIENQTIQVTLTLIPVAGGVGNIYLYVTWGIPGSLNWLDYPGNPVFTGIPNGYEINGVMDGQTLFEDNKYKMWFTGLNPQGVGVIEYAESYDGINWVRPYSAPVLLPGTGTWDQYGVYMGAIFKEDNQYKLYYNGHLSKYGGWHIGLATSLDGINWTKNPNPVLYTSAGWESQLTVSEIIKVNNHYYLYYSGVVGDPAVCKVGLATSTDGVNFTRCPSNPILVPTQSWEGPSVLSPSIIYENGSFTMIYANFNTNIKGFGKAVSTDGINWIKSSDNPFFTAQNTANHWTTDIKYPRFRKYNGEYRIYYSGYFPEQVYYKIGLLRSN